MAAGGPLLIGPCPTMTGSPSGMGPGERGEAGERGEVRERGEVGERGEAGERGEVASWRASFRSSASQDGIWEVG